MNRTSEFFAAVESQRANKHKLPMEQQPLHPSSSAHGLGRPKSEFAVVTGQMHKELVATSIKLQKLAKLAKRKTLFDDKPVEISELTYIIKQDIAKLNQQISLLQSQVREQNDKGTSSRSNGCTKQVMEHRAHVVVMLQAKLAAQTSIFKDVLELRTENMKASKDRREQFMFTTQHQVNAFATDSPLFNLEKRPTSNSTHDVLSLDLTTPSQQQQQQQLEQAQLVDSSNQYFQSRSSAVDSIESTLQELGGIFQQLAQMISEQRDMVQRIDANTDDIESNVAGAQTELLKYYSHVSSNRWLMVKVFAVLSTVMIKRLFVLLKLLYKVEGSTHLQNEGAVEL
ncbi:cis-Golgi t-SNARE syntaxin [Mortierella sp. GBA43]|nr:cis-Golgi t-SNARE syntaxin [Mortierella sp. GBA43]